MTEKDIKNFVIYKGQKFEADMAYIDIVVNDFVEQYPPLCIKPNPDCHDLIMDCQQNRYIIVAHPAKMRGRNCVL